MWFRPRVIRSCLSWMKMKCYRGFSPIRCVDCSLPYADRFFGRCRCEWTKKVIRIGGAGMYVEANKIVKNKTHRVPEACLFVWDENRTET